MCFKNLNVSNLGASDLIMKRLLIFSFLSLFFINAAKSEKLKLLDINQNFTQSSVFDALVVSNLSAEKAIACAQFWDLLNLIQTNVGDEAQAEIFRDMAMAAMVYTYTGGKKNVINPNNHKFQSIYDLSTTNNPLIKMYNNKEFTPQQLFAHFAPTCGAVRSLFEEKLLSK